MMKRLSLFLALAAVGFTAAYLHLRSGVCLTLAITFGTTAYHFIMRLLVGAAVGSGMKNRADYTSWWYRPRPWEEGFYRLLRVKSWKGRLPTYDPNAFSPRVHSWDEIAQATCQSEVVHEVIIPLSFLPLFAARWFGAFPVFLITSVCGAFLDLLFVLMQRYNRPRVVKLAQRQQAKNELPPCFFMPDVV